VSALESKVCVCVLACACRTSTTTCWRRRSTRSRRSWRRRGARGSRSSPAWWWGPRPPAWWGPCPTPWAPARAPFDLRVSIAAHPELRPTPREDSVALCTPGVALWGHSLGLQWREAFCLSSWRRGRPIFKLSAFSELIIFNPWSGKFIKIVSFDFLICLKSFFIFTCPYRVITRTYIHHKHVNIKITRQGRLEVIFSFIIVLSSPTSVSKISLLY